MIAATKLQPDHGQCQVVGPRLNGRGAVRTETGDSEVSRPGFAIEAGDVADLLDSLSGQGLRACVPERLGAVDALLGQTRHHHDLDLAIDAEQLDQLLRHLSALGYR